MRSLSLKKKDLPFLLGGAGELAIDTGGLALDQPFPRNAPAVLSAKFSAGGDRAIRLGQRDTVKVAVGANTAVDLTPVFAGSGGKAARLLTTCGLGNFFNDAGNKEKVVLCFDAAASGTLAGSGTFRYSALKASTELEAGGDAGFAYLRAFDAADPVGRVIPEFFKTMRLPEQAARAPEPGEAISMQYGGYLRLAAEASVGYRLAGTRSFSLGQIALSEKYDLSILGKVGLCAGVAGRFAILVTGDDDLPGWARVQVRRQRATDMKVAADVTVGFKNELDHLPPTATEFLGAVLGVNAKNFLNLFEKVIEFSDVTKLEGAIDGLARRYLEEFIGKDLDALTSAAAFKNAIASLQHVVTSYEQLGDRAVTLFDKYVDRLDRLEPFLEELQNLSSAALETLRKELSPELWTVLSRLTDGDPLGFLLGQITSGGKRVDSATELGKRAAAVLDLIRNPAHEGIRRAIALAKEGFGIEMLFSELAKVDTVDELRALANEKVGLFVTRLVGRTLDSAPSVKLALNEVHAVLARIDGFAGKLFSAFKEAANSSYCLALHSEYSRASETDALIDVRINMSHPRGSALLARAGRGDFEDVLATADTNLVRLRDGILTHRTRRDSPFNVNIIGWHLNYRYEGFDRVITSAEQHLIPSDRGLTVLTTTALALERERRRQGEAMHVNFLLQALGESAAVLPSDRENLAYLIDGLSSLTARYQLQFTDDDTSEMELRDYLAFARSVGLDAKGATAEELAPLLPRAVNGGFGKVETAYDVRFGSAAVNALLRIRQLSKPAEASIRGAMRVMVLSNYLKSEQQHDVAFSYATPAVFALFDALGPSAFTNASQRVFEVDIPNSGIAAPSAVVLNTMELHVLATLYNIENSFIEAIESLLRVLNGDHIKPGAFEKRLAGFGAALQKFDEFDQTTSARGTGTSTVFAMLDMLVRLAAGGASANVSLLRLRSQADGREVEKIFLSDAAAAAS